MFVKREIVFRANRLSCAGFRPLRAGGHQCERTTMKRFRRNAEYVADSYVFKSIDHNQRVIVAAAEGAP